MLAVKEAILNMSGQTDKFRKAVMTAAQSFAEASALPAFITIPDANYVYLNAAFKSLRNDDLESSILPTERIFDAESLQVIAEIARANVSGTEAALTFSDSDGVQQEMNFRVAIAQDEDRQRFVFGTAMPVGPRSTADQIRSSLKSTGKLDEKRTSLETQIFRFAERSVEGLLVLDENSLIRYVNASLERLFDVSRDEMIGKELHHLVSPTNPAAFERRVSQRIHAREGGTQTIEMDMPGLGRREISFRWNPISESPRATGFVINDVTTQVIRRRARRALASLPAASESREIMEGLRVALHADKAVLVSLWPNEQGELAVEEVVDGSDRAELGHAIEGEIESTIRDYLKSVGSPRLVHQLNSKPIDALGKTLFYRPIEDMAGRVEGFLLVLLDPCPDGWQVYEEVFSDFARRLASRFEFRRKSREIVERRKRESLEQLAHGIAHDFNNVLMSIYGHLQLMDKKLRGKVDDRVDRNLSHALRSADRAKQLVKAMINYSDNSLPSMVTIDLGEIVSETLKEIQAEKVISADLRLALEENCMVLGDPMTLRNAIEALVMNSVDAIDALDTKNDPREQESSGQIAVEVSRRVSMDGRDTVSLVISDNGSGMDEETRERVFDPFFTTRGPGKGTGLGMAVVQATVARMHGTIDINSRPERGTMVSISFPSFETVQPARPIRQTASFRATDTARARAMAARHILVVDDAAEQRELIVECLRDEGYSTEDVDDGAKAVDIITKRGEDFDLVIMDRLMPSLSGDQAVGQLRTQAPTLPVVILSGFIDKETRERFEELGVTACLQKPVGIAELVRTIDGIVKNRQRAARRE